MRWAQYLTRIVTTVFYLRQCTKRRSLQYRHSESSRLKRQTKLWTIGLLAILAYVVSAVLLTYSYFFAWHSDLPDVSREMHDRDQWLSALFGFPGLAVLLLAIVATVMLAARIVRRVLYRDRPSQPQ